MRKELDLTNAHLSLFNTLYTGTVILFANTFLFCLQMLQVLYLMFTRIETI